MAARADEVAEQGGLDPVVVRDDPERRVGGSDRVGGVSGDLGDEVDPVGAGGGAGRGRDRGLVGAERAGHRAGVAQTAGQAAGVDPGDGGDAEPGEVRVEGLGGAPAAGSAGEVADDDPATERAAALGVVGVDAVVPDVRVGERDDLPGVRGVGDDLLVAAQRGVEDDLADRDAAGGGRADQVAFERRPVREDEAAVDAHRWA